MGSNLRAKVFPANDAFVLRLLRDFRFESSGKRYVAKLEGEGRFSDGWSAGDSQRNVLVEFVPEADWLASRGSFLRRWLQALRLHYLAFSVLPQALVMGMLRAAGAELNFWLVAGALASTSLLHIACNLWNDYEDHIRGVDATASNGGSGTIQKLWIPALTIRNAAVGFFIASVAIGFYLLGHLPWHENGKVMLALGIVGTIGAASYSGWPFHYKYLALGELLVFFLCGPLIALGAQLLWAPSALPLWKVCLATYPLGLQAVLRVHGGNIRRIPYDIQAGARTIANLLGFKRATVLYALMLASLYLLLPLVYWSLGATPWLFLAYLSLPVAIYQVKLLREMRGPLDPKASQLRYSSTYLDLSFGLFYTLGFFI